MKTASISMVFVLATCLVLVVVACGGGEEEEPTPTPTATPPSATATPEATPSPTPTPTTYVVQPGDTLGEIADRFGVDVEALAAANDITDPGLIYAGQTLVIPAQAP